MTIALKVLALWALLPSTYYGMVYFVLAWMYDWGWQKYLSTVLFLTVIAGWAAWVWWII